MIHSNSYTERHNRIVGRLKNAAMGRYTVIRENQDVGGTGLHPDLVVARGEEAVVLDVTCPIDNQPNSLAAGRKEKVQKYQPVLRHIRRWYQRVTLDAIVISPLGSSDPANDRVMQKLCSRSYLCLLKKLAVRHGFPLLPPLYV